MARQTRAQLLDEVAALRGKLRETQKPLRVHLISIVFGDGGRVLQLTSSGFDTAQDVAAAKTAVTATLAQVDQILVDTVQAEAREKALAEVEESTE